MQKNHHLAPRNIVRNLKIQRPENIQLSNLLYVKLVFVLSLIATCTAMHTWEHRVSLNEVPMGTTVYFDNSNSDSSKFPLTMN